MLQEKIPRGCFSGVYRGRAPLRQPFEVISRHPRASAIILAGLGPRFARSLFDVILREIQAAQFCIFDSLGTLNRPNVYIRQG